MSKIRVWELLEAVTETGASVGVPVGPYRTHTFQINASDVTDGATITIEASLDRDNWVVYETFVIIADGNQMYSINDAVFDHVRANVTAYTDGTYTVLGRFGE